MATIVIVGNRDAAVEAALELGHRVVLISDRKVGKKRCSSLLLTIETDFHPPNSRTFIRLCMARLRDFDTQLPREVQAVVGVTERAVLPAAWLRAHLNVPGNSAECAYLCRNKPAMKRRLQAVGVDCAAFATVTGRTTAASLVQRLGLPLVLKPVDSSGARGATIARQQCDVEAAMAPGMLAEGFVHGVEMSVESFVRDGVVQFLNLTEYLVPLWSNVVPATLGERTRAELTALNQKVVAALGIQRGMTHMEVFLTPAQTLFSEIAVRPPGGFLMDLLRHVYAFDAWRAFFQIELGESVTFPTQPLQTAGVVLLHPGEGRVKKVSGTSRAARLPGVVEASCRVTAGETLTRRDGSGESAAHVLATGKTRADVVNALELARRAVVVELEQGADVARPATRAAQRETSTPPEPSVRRRPLSRRRESPSQRRKASSRRGGASSRPLANTDQAHLRAGNRRRQGARAT